MIINKKIHYLLKDSSLELDIEHGEIKRKKEKYRGIALEGPKELLFWTERALERYGYYIDSKNKSKIIIEYNNKKPVWILISDKQKFSFDSIYDLTLYLK